MPTRNTRTGKMLRWCLKKPFVKEKQPIIKAKNIIAFSNFTLSIMLIPNKGKLETANGSMAQCTAHTTDDVIPSASQLILNFIRM
ncbi:MAG TPA: hypothetical protein VM888_01055 [Chitinophagaceae bacterium]|nr:hypothetical protein [Chitinophagaceae bacterium]